MGFKFFDIMGNYTQKNIAPGNIMKLTLGFNGVELEKQKQSKKK